MGLITRSVMATFRIGAQWWFLGRGKDHGSGERRRTSDGRIRRGRTSLRSAWKGPRILRIRRIGRAEGRRRTLEPPMHAEEHR